MKKSFTLNLISCTIAFMCLTASKISMPASAQDTKPKAATNTQTPKQVPPTVKPPQHAKEFLKIRDMEMWRGKYEFTNIGVNIPDLFIRFLRGNSTSAVSALQDAEKAGVRFVRCDACSRSVPEFQKYVNDPTGWMAAFRQMLSAADDLGISVVPTLLPDIHLMPAAAGDPSIANYLKPGSPANNRASDYVKAMVSAFKSDPRVLFWEIGDEYNDAADLPILSGVRTESDCYSSDNVRDFLSQIAQTIHLIDKNHLVCSGNTDLRPNSWHLRLAMLAHRSAASPWSYPADETPDQYIQYSEMMGLLNPPIVDIVSIHQMPPTKSQVQWLVEDDEHAFRLPWSRQAAASVPNHAAGSVPGKPLFIGAFGQQFLTNGKVGDIAWTSDFIRRMRGGVPSLSALYEWESSLTSPEAASYSASVTLTPDLVTLMFSTNFALTAASLDAPYIK